MFSIIRPLPVWTCRLGHIEHITSLSTTIRSLSTRLSVITRRSCHEFVPRETKRSRRTQNTAWRLPNQQKAEFSSQASRCVAKKSTSIPKKTPKHLQSVLKSKKPSSKPDHHVSAQKPLIQQYTAEPKHISKSKPNDNPVNSRGSVSDETLSTVEAQNTLDSYIDSELKNIEKAKWKKAPKWVQKQAAKASLSDLEEPPNMTVSERLVWPAIFTAAVILVSVWGALNYKPPANADRLFPTVPVTITTIGAIVGINFLAFLAWKFPFTWKFMNKYMIVVPAVPRSIGLLGNAFSHQTLWHLTINMAVLFMLGTTVCEEIGRGNFLAMYTCSAVFASFCSLAFNVVIKRFEVFSFGASGAVYGVIGAYAYLFPDTKLWIIFLPFLKIPSYIVASVLGTYELTALVMAWQVGVDHMAHVTGMFCGIGIVQLIQNTAESRRKAVLAELKAPQSNNDP